MAYDYDQFGNVIGEYESEEERRKRLEAEAKAADTTVAQEQKVVTYQNGSQTVETKKEIPAVDPTVVANARAMAPPQAPQAAQPQPAPQLQFDRNAYNTSIAQAESGNRPDIGFHDRTKSTAFGLFGITSPAYQDARRRDPSLPEDITKATAEQQSRAQNILTDNNANFLQKRGVEPTPGVLSAAHFAGANGLHKFLTQKDDQGRPYISPQAQAANGGYDKARAIIEGRLNEQAVPSSGAVQRPPQAQPQEGVAVATGQGVQGTPTVMGPVSPQAVQQQAQNEMQGMQQFAQPAPVSPYSLNTGNTGMEIRAPGIAAGQPVAQPTTNYQNLFQQSQDNVNGLTQLIDNPDTPDYLKRRSADRRYELVNNTYMEEKAKAKIPNLTSNEVAKALSTTPRDAEGSWLKFLLMGFISPELAGAEAIKLGLGPTRWSTTTIIDANGNEIAAEVQTRADGKVLQGNITGTDTKLTAEQLGQAAGGILGKGVHISKVESLIDPETKQLVNRQTLSNGKEKYLAGGKPYTGDRSKLQDAGDSVKQEDRRVNAGYTNLAKLTANPTQQQKVEQLRLAGVPMSRIEQEIGAPAGSLTGQGAGQPAAATAPAPARAQPANQRPVQAPGEYDKDYKLRLDAFENKTKLQQKDAEAFASTAVETRAQLQQIQNAVDVVKSGNYFMGPLFGTEGKGILPAAQEFFSSKFGDQTSTDNTRMLRSLITREGLQGIKNSMGPSISNFDVQAWLKSNPVTEQSSPQALQKYFTKLHNTLYELSEQKRKIAVEQGMLAPSFNFGNKIGEAGGQSDVRSRADSIIGQ